MTLKYAMIKKPHKIYALSFHTVLKSRNMNEAKYVSNFLMCGANNVVENSLGKKLKSCIGVLLRADITGHSHPSPSAKKGGMALKRATLQDFIHN